MSIYEGYKVCKHCQESKRMLSREQVCLDCRRKKFGQKTEYHRLKSKLRAAKIAIRHKVNTLENRKRVEDSLNGLKSLRHRQSGKD